jgi:hypothetical protein
MLWPDVVRSTLKLGPDREIVSVYPYRSAVPKALWRDLIAGARQQLVFAGYTNYFLWLELSDLRGLLRQRAQEGAMVRFLVGDPTSLVTLDRERLEAVPLTVSTRIRITLDELAKLRTETAVQARFSDQHIALSVFSFDEDMIVSMQLANVLGQDSPALHIRRRQDNGMYDRFAGHVEQLWAGGRDVWAGQ